MSPERIEQIADKIVEMKLSAPAMFLLEAHIPFTTVFQTATIAISPIAAPLLGSERINFLSELFSDRRNIENLVSAIERIEDTKRRG